MVFESKRLRYKKFTNVDLSDFQSLMTDALVTKYITGKRLTETEAAARFDLALKTNQLHADAGFFSVKTKEDSKFIGLAKFVYTRIDQAEVGYALLPDFWKQHYTTEIVSCLLHYATTQPQLTQLIAIVDPGNAVSINILTNFHFVHETRPETGKASTDCYVLNQPFCRL